MQQSYFNDAIGPSVTKKKKIFQLLEKFSKLRSLNILDAN